MIDNELLKKLDAAAYNVTAQGLRPDIMPPEILRNDRAYYRIYFRYMAALYMMHDYGVMDIESLKNLKSAFMRDFGTYSLMFGAAAQAAHEFRKLNSAIIACNKNKDNCEFCAGIYNARCNPCTVMTRCDMTDNRNVTTAEVTEQHDKRKSAKLTAQGLREGGDNTGTN